MPAIPLLAGTVSKLFLNYGCKEVKVTGLEAFLERLNGPRGILTVANHISVVDEPFMWGVLPLTTFMDTRTTRWTLGASDMMFNGKLDSWFFSKGQVIETHRGKGIYQKAIDEATYKLEQGQWIHMFPEGRIKQEALHELRRFKWGVSRILMEVKDLPLVIPIWIKGFDQVMSEDAPWPKRLPRPNKSVEVIIGEPVNPALEPLLARFHAAMPNKWRPETYDRHVAEDLRDEPVQLTEARSEVAAVLREELMRLGRAVGAGREGV